MSELGENRPLNAVATGNGWSVGKTASGFTVKIDRKDGLGSFAVDVDQPATDTERDEAEERLIDMASEDIELDRIEEAFAAPWVQA